MSLRVISAWLLSWCLMAAIGYGQIPKQGIAPAYQGVETLFPPTGQKILGRATFYTSEDGYGTINDGSCACRKRKDQERPCKDNFCFDYIGSPPPAPGGPGFIAAINTPGLTDTDQCGGCYSVRCIPGPTRGTPESIYPFPGCTGNDSITVMITDSCPCLHENTGNRRWCCGDRTNFDLSYWAFGAIANHSVGVIDVEFERLESCGTAQLGVYSPTCDAYYKENKISGPQLHAPAAAPQPSAFSSSGMSGGAIAGAVVGSLGALVILLAAAIVIAFIVARRRKARGTAVPSSSPTGAFWKSGPSEQQQQQQQEEQSVKPRPWSLHAIAGALGGHKRGAEPGSSMRTPNGMEHA